MTDMQYNVVAAQLFEKGFIPVDVGSCENTLKLVHLSDGYSDEAIDRKAREVKVMFEMFNFQNGESMNVRVLWKRVSRDEWRQAMYDLCGLFGYGPDLVSKAVDAKLCELEAI